MEGAGAHFVVLDLDQTDPSGWDLVARLAELTTAPILVRAETGTEESTITALGLGASAFLFKPVSLVELCLRIEAAVRRGSIEPWEDQSISDAFFQIDMVERWASVLGRVLKLTPVEFRLLVAFARRPGEALGHERILDLVWPGGFRERNQVKLNVSYLRRSVRRVAPVDPITTVPGIGYRYEPRRLADESA